MSNQNYDELYKNIIYLGTFLSLSSQKYQAHCKLEIYCLNNFSNIRKYGWQMQNIGSYCDQHLVNKYLLMQNTIEHISYDCEKHIVQKCCAMMVLRLNILIGWEMVSHYVIGCTDSTAMTFHTRINSF
jgi:hypothetical protein